MSFVEEFHKKQDSIEDYIHENASGLLLGFGITGLVASVISAVVATKNAMHIIDEIKDISENMEPSKEKNEIITKKVGHVALHYIPTVLLTAGSISCFVGSYSINMKKIASLTTLYALSEESFREYREKTRQIVGEKKEQQIHDEMVKEANHKNPPDIVDDDLLDSDYILCKEFKTGRLWKSTLKDIYDAEANVINYLARTGEMWVDVNTLYDYLGIESTADGNDWGWTPDVEPHFTNTWDINPRTGRRMLIIDYDRAHSTGRLFD